MSEVDASALTYTVAGILTTPSGRYDSVVFSPGTGETRGISGDMFNFSMTPLDVAEFTLADNFRSEEFRTYADRLVMIDGAMEFVMDTSKLENPRNTLRLLESLYPGAFAAALLIGGFLCCLIIVQSSKEAAIMRIQGTTKGRTRALLSIEQISLSVAGLVVGWLALLIYRGRELGEISGEMALFAALYFGVILASAVVCSVLATRRSALGLLQTKE